MDVKIPGYTIKRVLGKGGMATVYLAEQDIFERDVALKVMNARLTEDPSFGQRFMREAKIVSKLVHPNIITVYDVGVHNDLYYLSMEHINGPDLKTGYCDLSLSNKLNVIHGVAKALAYAGKKGVVHRDIKAENILLRADSLQPVLMDFGIARAVESDLSVTQTGMSLGTPHYMSPEQARGAVVDHRADLYSLGVVLYFILMGEVPFQADSAVAVGIKHITEPVPELPEVLQPLQYLLSGLMAKMPADRFQTADEFIRALAKLKKSTISEIESAFLQNPAELLQCRGAKNQESPTLIETALHKRATPVSKRFHLRIIAPVMLVCSTAIVYVFILDTRDRAIPGTEQVPLRQAVEIPIPKTDENEQSGDSAVAEASIENTLELSLEGSLEENDEPPPEAPNRPPVSGIKIPPPLDSEQLQNLLQGVRKRLQKGVEAPTLENARALEVKAVQLKRRIERRGGSDTNRVEVNVLIDEYYQYVYQLLVRGEFDKAQANLIFIDSMFPRFTAHDHALRSQIEAFVANIPLLNVALIDAQNAIAEKRFAAPQENSALYYYLSMLNIQPECILPLQKIQDLLAMLKSDSELLYDEGQWGRAYPLIKQMLVIDPAQSWAKTVAKTIEDYQREVNRLNSGLDVARGYFEQDQLFTPQDDNAYAALTTVLAEQPDNQAALELIEQSQIRFAQIIESLIDNGEAEKAKQRIELAVESVGDMTFLSELADSIRWPKDDIGSSSEPNIKIVRISDRPIEDIRKKQKKRLRSTKSLYGAISYSGFRNVKQVLYAVLESESAGQFERVPIVISADVGETHFRIERSLNAFAEGTYRLRLFHNEEVLGETRFQVGRSQTSGLF